MKGYWHFPALSAAISIFTVQFHTYWFIAAFIIWLLYLFFTNRLGKIPVLVSVVAFLFFYLFVPSLSSLEKEGMNSFSPSDNLLTGRIINQVRETPKKLEFVLEEEKTNRNIQVVFFPNDNTKFPRQKLRDIKNGARCQITGSIELPEKARNPGQFDFNKFLLAKGITHQLILASPDDIACSGSSYLSSIYDVRKNLIRYVEKNVGSATSPWINALVLGDDSLIDENTVELFRKWGLSHILAISGLHVGLIIALLYFLLIKLNVLTKEKAGWLMIFFLPFYAIIAGGEPSVWRASLMALFFILLGKWKLRYSVTDVISIVFILLILMDKFIIYNVGFQFSFLVTFGLLLSKDWFMKNSSSFLLMLRISFISQMMILPLQLAYFYTFQPLSILLNLIVVPYFSFFVIPLMFFLLILSPVSTTFMKMIDSIFGDINGVFIAFIESVDQIADFPMVIGPLPTSLVIIYYALFFLLMKHVQVDKPRRAFGYGILAALLLAGIAIRPYFSPIGSVTMLDIGQGDAFVIELPYRKAVIFIDAGAKVAFGKTEPSDTVYKQIIKPYLYSKGINRIDALFLSHEDADHIGSAPFILEEMDVDNVITSNYFEMDQDWNGRLKRIEAKQEVIIGGQSFYVVSPLDKNDDANENSLVLYTKIGGKDWLFTGDIGKDTEKKIANTFPNLDVDVLKIAHHGSATSTEKAFINEIEPAYSWISVGKNNAYGHPTEEVLNTLRDEEVIVFRTDKDGAVQYRFKDNRGTFLKYLP